MLTCQWEEMRPSWSQGRVWPAIVTWSPGCKVVLSLHLVSPLVGEAGLEACLGFLAGVAGACPLVGRAGFWPCDEQEHV